MHLNYIKLTYQNFKNKVNDFNIYLFKILLIFTSALIIEIARISFCYLPLNLASKHDPYGSLIGPNVASINLKFIR